jgi:hypothetical protein
MNELRTPTASEGLADTENLNSRFDGWRVSAARAYGSSRIAEVDRHLRIRFSHRSTGPAASDVTARISSMRVPLNEASLLLQLDCLFYSELKCNALGGRQPRLRDGVR